jgi:hypothetical protein
MLALQFVGETGAPHHLRIQAFGRQVEERKIAGMRRRDIVRAHRTSLLPKKSRERLARRLRRVAVGALERVLQPLPFLHRKLGVDGDPASGLVRSSRHSEREFHAFPVPGTVSTLIPYCPE